jgi:hypothetical protein
MTSKLGEGGYLHFDDLDRKTGSPPVASCSACRRTFLVEPNTGEGLDSVLLRIRAEFDAPNCSDKSR